MDLEMQGGTEDLATAGVAAAPAELERQPYDDFDVAVIRATQGDMPVVPEPYAPAAARARHHRRRACSTTCAGMVERGLLRRVAAILFHRRAGFRANGMGVWKVPDDKVLEIGPRMASFRGISHCYQRPTYEDWPYQLFTMAHGRSKEECDAVLDAVAASTPDLAGPRDPLQLDRVQEDPPPVLHRRLPRLGARARAACERLEHRLAAGHAIGRALRARRRAAARRGELARARDARDRARPRSSSSAASGAEIVDVDGNRYVDWVCSWGPLIHGHAHPEVVAAVVEAARAGDVVRRADDRRGGPRRRGRARGCRRSRCCG